MPSDKNPTAERRAAYVTITGLFLSLFTAFAFRERKKHENMDLRPFDLVQLGLATFRLGRLIAYDTVTEALRAPVAETRADESGAGDTTAPKRHGIQQALGELITCPICCGTWIAAALIYGLGIAPRATRVMVAIMSSVGAAELLNAAVEALEWTGQARREQIGTERLL